MTAETLTGLRTLLSSSSNLEVLSVWLTETHQHVLLHDTAANRLSHAAYPMEGDSFTSLSDLRPNLDRMERTLADLSWKLPEGAADRRPWTDHGRWPAQGTFRGSRFIAAAPYRWAEEPQAAAVLPVGPVHAGIIEPGLFRFSHTGESVHRLEIRLGYKHRGLEAMMIGQEPAAAARLAARLSGDSTAAWSLAYAQAVEQFCPKTPSLPDQAGRRLVLELERLANHLGDLGALFGDVALHALQMELWAAREELARRAEAAFGHRLLMDCIRPGAAIACRNPDLYSGLEEDLMPRLDRWQTAYHRSAPARDRMQGTGLISRPAADRQSAGGITGRASGRSFDARSADPLLQELGFTPLSRTDGDVEARLLLRFDEARQSLALIRTLLPHVQPLEFQPALLPPIPDGAAFALVEGFRGPVLVWLAVNGGRLAAVHLRDPSWAHWPLLEEAMQTAILADFPLVNKSINGSYAGHDG